MNVDINAIKRRLLVKYPLFGSVIANVNFVENNDIGTAATDGENIYYNVSFLEDLNIDEQVFILAHEVCHIAFDHLKRSEGKDKKLWNIATDSVINALLKNDGLPLVEGGIDNDEAIKYNAEEMYNKLLKEKNYKNNKDKNKQYDNNMSSNENNNMNSSGGTSDDSNNDNEAELEEIENHDLWDKAIEKGNQNENDDGDLENKDGSSSSNQKDEKQEVKKQSIFDKLFNKDKKKNNNLEEDKQTDSENNDKKIKEQEKQQEKTKELIDKLSKLGEKESFKENKKEKKRNLEDLRNSLIEQSHNAGNSTNEDIRNISDIGTSKPLIDWRLLLKEAVKIDVDWSYKNASVEDGVITANLEEIPQPETEIVLDTSGSIDESLLKNFLRECKNILQTSKVKVGCFDTKFYDFTEIRNINDIDNMEFRGGGGTNFDVAVSAFSKRVENKIIFTDGKASMPDESIDAIWIVFGGKKINPRGGRVIYISDEQLEKLYNNRGHRFSR